MLAVKNVMEVLTQIVLFAKITISEMEYTVYNNVPAPISIQIMLIRYANLVIVYVISSF